MYDALVGRSEDAVLDGGQDAVDADATSTMTSTPVQRAPTDCPSACPPPGGGSGPGGGGGGGGEPLHRPRQCGQPVKALQLKGHGVAQSVVHAQTPRPRLDLPDLDDPYPGVPRPLSVSSIASSSSSSSGTSSCSGNRRLGAAPKSSAYLASIESLEDTDEDDDNDDLPRGKTSASNNNNSVSSQGSGSGDSGVCSPCSPRHPHPHLSFMDRVVMEIIETEGVYVRDLHQIIVGYLTVLSCRPDCPLGASQLDALFSNIQDVYRFNSHFLRQLEQCGLDPVRVARCFVRNNQGFSVYTEYCTNYPRTVGVLTDLMRREATARLFRERQAALQHTLPLGSYLLKPVQRILKYHLLLQNIVKHSDARHGHSDIVHALATMTAIAHHINDMKRRHEHAVRVQEIQSLLYCWQGEDLTTFGELCAEGTFRVAGAKALRHVFLFDKMLLITKKKEEGILGYKAHIMCSNLMLIESVPGEPLSFHVIPFDNPRMQYTLQARNLEQKREWSLQLKRVILENYNAVIPTHARQLVMELGQNRTDDEILADKVTPRRQHSAPEYLEKRKQERERRKSEAGLRYRLRRNRKTDADAIAESATRRGRRGSSSSREGEREDSTLSLADRTRDRFANWRRKSEPSGLSGKRLVVADLRVEGVPELARPADDVQADDQDCDRPAQAAEQLAAEEALAASEATGDDADQDASRGEGVTTTTVVVAAAASEGHAEDAEMPSPQPQPAETMEQIVSQLLMQNREFQRILKRQQRQINLRHRGARITATASSKEETSDDDEEEEEAIYETLSALATVNHYPRLGPRHGHAVIPRTECSNDEDDYVTLVCHDGVAEDADEAATKQQPDVVAPTAPPRVRLKRNKEQQNGHKHVELRQDAGGPTTGLGARPDSLPGIWERLRRSQRGKASSSSASACKVRRAASFTSSLTSSAASSSNSHFYVDTPTPTSPSACQPISPAAWLKQLGPHLVALGPAASKSGSLPRSFQVGPEGEALPGRSKETLRARILRNGRSCPDRPFTIASDQPSCMSMDDMERFEQRFNGDTTEDDSLTEYTATPGATPGATPSASLHELNVHPEYKIYRPSISLKHVISSVSRLAGPWTGLLSSGRDAASSASWVGTDATDWDRERARALQRERRANRAAAAAVKQYSKTLRRRIRNLIGDADDAPATPPRSTPLDANGTTTTPSASYKQGSSRLGARIAHCLETSEYADPRLLFHNIRPSKKAAALLGIRPDSVLSVSSNLTSSSDGDKTSGFGGSVDYGVDHTAPPASTLPCPSAFGVGRAADMAEIAAADELVESDCSADSFYERSFEAMESVLETDMFRDSAVFSDHDDSLDSDSAPRYPPPPPPREEHATDDADEGSRSSRTAMTMTRSSSLPAAGPAGGHKVPPPVPSKPKGLRASLAVAESSHVLCRASDVVASLATLAVEEECDNSSQYSAASTVIETGLTTTATSEPPRTFLVTCPVGPTSKGWVKHVIGRLQGEGTHT